MYGPHQQSIGGMGEVRIVILTRRDATRRTRRQPTTEGRGRGRTGRWQVALIRRGVAGVSRRIRRRRREQPSVNENEDDRTEQDSTDTNVGEDNHREDSASSDDDGEDDLFHPSRSSAIISESNDPLIGRIGTMATVTFTHEETTNHDPEGAGQRASSIWQQQGGELVLTVLGTTRVRLIKSMKDKQKGRHDQIPIYAVEEIHDESAKLPPSWTMQHPGNNTRCPITTRIAESSLVMNDDKEDNSETRHAEVVRDYDEVAIQNLSRRVSTPVIAFQSTWPWKLCRNICKLIQQTDEFQGLSNILHSAAGLQYERQDINELDSSPNELPTAYFQVVDPSAFANWIAINMPLSQNDRLDILEMICTVEQLRFILKKLKESNKQETRLRCKHCGANISRIRHVFSVSGSEGISGTYVNEHGVVHHTVTLREVDRHSVVCIGPPETKDSWFPGYSWQIAYCAICSDHIGWKFRSVTNRGSDDSDQNRPRSFWGFSNITTSEYVQPRRTTFHTQPLTALLRRG